MRDLVPRLVSLACSVFMANSCPVVADPGVAIGPAAVASADDKLWPEPINSAAGFDKASRASLLIYWQNLQTMRAMSDEEMLAGFKIKSVNRNSVEKWLDREQTATLANYQLASVDCSGRDWTCIAASAAQQALGLNTDSANISSVNVNSLAALSLKVGVPKTAVSWRDAMFSFTRTYIGEQIRLAALFPKVTSEIDTFSNREWTGSGLADKQFYLSFDDGPSAAQGHSDATLAMLAREKKSASFFILGDNLQKRINATSAAAVNSLYGNQCVALHGWQHQSHAKWALWQDSIVRSQALLAKTFDKNNLLPLFRPPYGQRRDDSGEFFKAQDLHLALWNIDSQDWNSRVDASAVRGRIISLMLIKRHGVILFHDIHPKASLALPSVFAALGPVVTWGDCHLLVNQ